MFNAETFGAFFGGVVMTLVVEFLYYKYKTRGGKAFTVGGKKLVNAPNRKKR